MQELSKQIFSYLKKAVHRLLLWTKPSYLKHRTPEQKSFDLKIQYMFIGCIVGIIIVGVGVHFKQTNRTHHPMFIEETEITETTQQTETVQKEPIEEPSFVFDSVTPAITITPKKVTTTELTLQKNETLSGMLKRANVSLAQSLEMAKALELVCEIKKLRPGQTFEIFFIEDDFQGIKFENRNGETISVLKNQNKEFIPQAKEGFVENKRFVLQGVLKSSFSESAQKAGVPNSIIKQVEAALVEKIDFKKDLKPDAPFKIIYEQKITDTGKLIGKSQLLYVSLETHKNTCQRYFFIDSLGVRGYYDENGESTPQIIMTRPLGKARVSSAFGMRLHPILGYQIQHKGIDYAAPLGTPIPAAADGVVKKLNRNGGYGKYIQIKHNDTYSTAYGHLHDYNSELRVGSYVKKGDIIGYVGNTGRSTGPHLHYEIIKNKQPVNPLKTYTIPQRTLKNQTLEQFKKKKDWLDSLEFTQPFEANEKTTTEEKNETEIEKETTEVLDNQT